MNQRQAISAGALLGGLAVITGAFGAHALKSILTGYGRLETFELAVRYQFYHSLGILVAGLLMGQLHTKYLSYASLSFVIGIIIFSGSLYVLSLTGIKFLGAITPFGGVAFILGWFFIFMAALKTKSLS
jgi:uncharacterized membrane protein YgdD (TMEM256/DUF423 family)